MLAETTPLGTGGGKSSVSARSQGADKRRCWTREGPDSNSLLDRVMDPCT